MEKLKMPPDSLRKKMDKNVHKSLLLLGFIHIEECKYYHSLLKKNFDFSVYSDKGIIYLIYQTGFSDGKMKYESWQQLGN